MLVIATREKTVNTTGAGEDSKDGKSGKYLKNLIRVSCIQYSIIFWRKSVSVSMLFDSSSEIHVIHLTFAQELGPSIRQTDIKKKKIDSTTLDTYRMVIIIFLVTDKVNWIRFFEKTFLVANISLKLVLRMLFLTMNSVDVNFLDWKL